jgi:hypothetical protein
MWISELGFKILWRNLIRFFIRLQNKVTFQRIKVIIEQCIAPSVLIVLLFKDLICIYSHSARKRPRVITLNSDRIAWTVCQPKKPKKVVHKICG